MKKMKTIHWLFIGVAIISTVIEYSIIHVLFFRLWWQLNDVLSWVLTGVLFLICLNLMLISFRHSEAFEADKDEELSAFHQEIIERMKTRFANTMGRDVDIMVANAYNQPAFMFAYLGKIIINSNQNFSYKRINNAHFEGVLAHEMGHIAHMPKVYHMALLRPSSMISNFLLNLCFTASAFFKKKTANPFPYLWFGLLYLGFILTSPLNMLCFYPFKRYEELAADRMALRFSNGYSLRGYYYRTVQQMSRWDRIRLYMIDLNHPSPTKHYQQLRQAMAADQRCELYSDQRIDVLVHDQHQHQNAMRLDFYQKHIDHQLVNMYTYIAKLYEKQGQIDDAKQYYLKAGESGRKGGYRQLIRLMKAEGKTIELMPHFKSLARLGDKEADIIETYYERWFIEATHDEKGQMTARAPIKGLLLALDGRALLMGFDRALVVKFTRKNTLISLQLDEKQPLSFRLDNETLIEINSQTSQQVEGEQKDVLYLPASSVTID